MDRIRTYLLVGLWLVMGLSLGCNGGESPDEPADEPVGEAQEEDRVVRLGVPTITSPADPGPVDSKTHVCVNTPGQSDCDYQLSGNPGAVRIPLSGSVVVTDTAYTFDDAAIASMRSNGAQPGLKGRLQALLDSVPSGCDVVAGSATLQISTASFFDAVTLSADKKTLYWDMTGNAAATFDTGGCSLSRAPVHLTMELLLPLVYSANGTKIDAPLLISSDYATVAAGTRFYQLPSPIILTNDAFDEGATNSCAAPQVLSVQPGWSVSVSGKTAMGTSDYYVFRFDGAYGIPWWYFPKLTLTNTAGGQYAMQVKTPGCGGYAQGGANCGGNITSWSQSFPDQPNGCNNTYGSYTCTDASTRITEVVVQIVRLSGSGVDQYYTLNASNCNGSCGVVLTPTSNGFTAGDGYANTCAGAEYYDVQPGTSYDLTGRLPTSGGSDFFIANFQGPLDVAKYYHPKIDMISDGGGQYRFRAWNVGCSGANNCGGNLQTWEQYFPSNPNGCLGDYGGYTCSDWSTKITQVVVEVVRVNTGTSPFTGYTVRLSNQ
ncbi:MAG: hypothetical protein QM820_40925 [Minicystis sp.]